MTLNSEKVYELVIFKDPTGFWRNPTVCSIPVDGNTVSTLSSFSSLQNLRRLSAAQIAYLSGHLANTNQQMDARKQQQRDAAIESLPPLSKLSVQSFEVNGVEGSTMIYTPSVPNQGPLPPPRHVPNRPGSPYYHSSCNSSPRVRPVIVPPPSRDDIETPWKLEAVDFDMAPQTVVCEAEPYYDSPVRYRGGRRRATANTENSRNITIGIESYRPTKLAETEFTAIYSRYVANASLRSRFDDPPIPPYPTMHTYRPSKGDRVYLVKDAARKPGTEDEDDLDGMGDLEIVDKY